MVLLRNYPHPTEGIKVEQPYTTVYCNEREIGKGSLFVTESVLLWVNNSSGEGFSLEYPHIIMHAISRDIEAHGHECIYLMVDTGSGMEDAEESPEDDNSDSGNEHTRSETLEMRLVPEDKDSLTTIYQALNECQMLHPDPTDSFSDDDDIFEDAAEDEHHIGNGDAPPLNELVNGLEKLNGRNIDEAMDTDGQFEDADFVPDD